MSKIAIESMLVRTMPHGALQAAARLLAVDDLALELGIVNTGGEMQEAADRFRSERGLLDYQDTVDWLSARGLTLKTWQEDLRTAMNEAKLKAHAAVGAAARARFEGAPEAFRKINVGHAAVEDEGIAREIHLLLTEERIRFDVVARRYSVLFADGISAHPTSRRTLFAHEAPPPVASVALVGDFGGPRDIEPFAQGGLWHLFRLYTVEAPAYDRETESRARADALEAMLAPHVTRHFVALLDRLGCPHPSDPVRASLLTPEERFRAALRLNRPARGIEVVSIERAADVE